MTKEMLREKIEEIKDKGEQELRDFEMILSKSDVSGRARNLLERAIKLRLEELEARESAIVVDGDIDDTDY